MLSLKNVNVKVGEARILDDLDLEINSGQVHVVMGPNGSGKSTLAKVLAGHPEYQVGSGTISYTPEFKDLNLLEMEPDERALKGIFLAFQYPTEVPGISNAAFLKEAFNAQCRAQGAEEMDAFDFDEFLDSKLKLLDMKASFKERELNVDFSGGEKKRNEILQMAILNPKLAILDETDSGLDVDSLKVVAQGIQKLRKKSNSMLLITHYPRILEYLEPDFIHVLYQGKIIKSGDISLAKLIEKEGFDALIKESL